MKPRTLEALRALAERPGTAAEGIAAREILARLEAKHLEDKPEDMGIWSAFEAQCSGDISANEFLERLSAWERQQRAKPFATHWSCACGLLNPVGGKCHDQPGFA